VITLKKAALYASAVLNYHAPENRGHIEYLIIVKAPLILHKINASPFPPKLESTVRYLGIDVDDALEMAEQTEV